MLQEEMGIDMIENALKKYQRQITFRLYRQRVGIFCMKGELCSHGKGHTNVSTVSGCAMCVCVCV